MQQQEQDNADIRHAVYQTVHEFPARRGMNSVQTAAQVLMRAAGTVYNKADPGNDDQSFTIEEMVSLMTAAQDYRVLHAVCSACGFVAVQLKGVSSLSDRRLFDLLCEDQAAFGDKAHAIREALDDGQISAVELGLIRTRVYTQARASLELLSRLEGMAHGQRLQKA
jgi:hypothetical protein